MNIITYNLDAQEYQQVLNNAKDSVIEQINNDLGLKIDPCQYVFILQTRGCLGRMWDKLVGAAPEGKSSFLLMKVIPPKQKTPSP